MARMNENFILIILIQFDFTEHDKKLVIRFKPNTLPCSIHKNIENFFRKQSVPI